MNGLITCTDLIVAALASKPNWACAVILHPLSTCLRGRPTLPLSHSALFWLLYFILRHLLSAHCDQSFTLPSHTQKQSFVISNHFGASIDPTLKCSKEPETNSWFICKTSIVEAKKSISLGVIMYFSLMKCQAACSAIWAVAAHFSSALHLQGKEAKAGKEFSNDVMTRDMERQLNIHQQCKSG